ncbi:small GTP-binding protein [Tritrichomonas foetus]|uniref:Small GTP-binding protein n=1 Tax=Tritrichomonas foetus TaxID=1144522 RepID=A0A1J4JSX6_9EUKA|nr:small GTP-binding protein [Tritrichomonas foetus]|eukprot:OHT02163.1 small GTP-binding protein [Tritrichomonas foetus]
MNSRRNSIRTLRTTDLVHYKVVLLGASNTGKTSIIQRLVFHRFNQEVMPTLGAGLSTYDITINDRIISLDLWDTAGQESYRSLAKIYYHDTQAAIIVYDVTSIETFYEIKYWLNELKSSENSTHVLAIVGNKVDRADERVVTPELARAFANDHNAFYYETSALTGEGVTALFKKISLELMSKFHHRKEVNGIEVTQQNTDKKNFECCF